LNGGAKPGGKTLLVIDQFEELFGTGPETGRGYRESNGFYKSITNAVTGNNKSFHAIIIRSDLVSECAQYKFHPACQ
jgi:hypothetical protein